MPFGVVQAFGGRLFGEEYRVILDRGGFANWLAWLKDARDTPGMILDSNREGIAQSIRREWRCLLCRLHQ